MEADDDTLVGELNTHLAGRRLWLVKIPPYLMKDWESSKSNEILGHIEIESPKKAGGDIVMRLNAEVDAESSVPREHKLKLLNHEIFSENPEGQMKVEGWVDTKCDVIPVANRVYETHVGQRTKVSDSKDVHAIKLGEKVKTRIERPLYNSDHFKRQREIDERRKEKRDRMPEEKLLERLFILFERKKEWSLKELQGYTQQPLTYLKEVVDKVCVSSPVGRNMFELKQEYIAQDHESWE